MNSEYKATILVVDDKEAYRILVKSILEGSGYEVLLADSGINALEILRRKTVDLALLDLMMPKMDGRELMKRIHQNEPDMPIVFLTAHGSIPSAVDAIKDGASDYLTKPLPHVDDLTQTVKRVIEMSDLKKQNSSLIKNYQSRSPFPAKDPIMLALLAKSKKVAKTDVTVLITGESGTGKELLAQYLHQNSQRDAFPMVSLNCAAIVGNLLESELFGHEKGSFTGATERRIGRFEEAKHSTIFLDEIGEIDLSLQPKLLRALQERELRRVGGDRVIKFDSRIIVATNKNLIDLCDQKLFREDLYYRLSVITLNIPSLRERPLDIIYLSKLFVKKFAKKFKKSVTNLDQSAHEILLKYSWPGNVRELSNVIEASVLLLEGELLKAEDIQGIVDNRVAINESVNPLDNAEKVALIETLKKFDGNRAKTAEFLDMSKRNLIYKLKKHGLTRNSE